MVYNRFQAVSYTHLTVLNKADNTPVSGMPVIITETAEQTEQPEETPDVSGPEESPAPSEEPEATQAPEATVEPDATGAPDQSEGDENSETSPERPVSASGVTDKNGKVTVPPLNEDVTGDDGNGDITEDKPGEDTDGDGEPDTGCLLYTSAAIVIRIIIQINYLTTMMQL